MTRITEASGISGPGNQAHPRSSHWLVSWITVRIGEWDYSFFWWELKMGCRATLTGIYGAGVFTMYFLDPQRARR